jgi:hypothetical protein
MGQTRRQPTRPRVREGWFHSCAEVRTVVTGPRSGPLEWIGPPRGRRRALMLRHTSKLAPWACLGEHRRSFARTTAAAVTTAVICPMTGADQTHDSSPMGCN